MRTLLLSLLIASTVLLAACTSYTHDQPDTKANIAGFERHFCFAPPPDVSELYYYVDELGADVKYQLGFKAELSTVEKIVSELALKQEQPAPSQAIATEFPWWQESELASLTPYWKKNQEGDYYWYLWYDVDSQRVWFLEFST